MGLADKLELYASRVETVLESCMPSVGHSPEILYESMRYSAMGGGKRLRASLLYAACELMDGDLREADPYAAAIEMIHASSLINDDLPAMDDDDYRRGKLSCHKAYGEAMAILAGDGLLMHACLVMNEASIRFAGNLESHCKAQNYILKASGIFGMIAGQTQDVISVNSTNNAETLDFIHTKKTAAMIAGALKAGLQLSDPSEYEMKRISDYGDAIGLAYQIRDDLLDISGSSSALGKTPGKDAASFKLTYPGFHGVPASEKRILELSQTARSAIKEFNNNSFLYDIVDMLAKRER